MEQRTLRKLAWRLMAYCRTHKQDAHNTYQFYQRIVRNADGTEHDQTLFADGFVLLDVTPLMDFLTYADGEQGVDAGHWHDSDAPGFRSVDLAQAWDAWQAEEASDTLAALNLYSYYHKELCQWFSVIGPQDDDGGHRRRVLIDTKFLRLMSVERIEPYDEFIFTISADGKVQVVDDAAGVTLGYVMPIADGVKNAKGHHGQLNACSTCGGDGDYHPVRVDEAVTA